MEVGCEAYRSLALEGDKPRGNQIFGWLAIFGAWATFGSFAVPMKWISVKRARIHPLVFQCYKTFWTFATSHLVLFFVPYEFSVWGIASGFSWVPAGVAAVVAVQNAGIACGQAIWQVTIIATSFVWGFFVFRDEAVHTMEGTVFSFVALCAGVVGMTVSFNLRPEEVSDDAAATKALLSESSVSQKASLRLARPRSRNSLADIRFGADDLAEDAAEGTCVGDKRMSHGSRASTASSKSRASMPLGIAAALFNGLWGGSNLVPSHYASVHGVHFCISFATGAVIANAVLVFGYVVLAKCVWKSELPSPEFRVMLVPGFVSGTLWSAGNLCSLYAVEAIGQGIGYSLVQSSVIVSGLWGICYYREMTGKPVLYWCASVCVCLAGVLGIAAEKC